MDNELFLYYIGHFFNAVTSRCKFNIGACKAAMLQSGIHIDVDGLHSPVGLPFLVPQCYQVCKVTIFELISKGKCLLHTEKCPPQKDKKFWKSSCNSLCNQEMVLMLI